MTSPMWKGVGAATGGSGKRSVLRVLPANARNSKLLVGAGSQRTASFGKSTKTSFPESVVRTNLRCWTCVRTCDDVVAMSG